MLDRLKGLLALHVAHSHVFGKLGLSFGILGGIDGYRRHAAGFDEGVGGASDLRERFLRVPVLLRNHPWPQEAEASGWQCLVACGA